MRWPGLLAAVMLFSCGGGGGGSVPQMFQQRVSFGIVRADAPTPLDVQIANPLVANATVAGDGGPSAPFALAEAIQATVVGSGSLEVRLVFTPVAPGDHEGEFRLHFLGSDGSRVDIVLALDAFVETPVLAMTAATVAFPPTVIGASSIVRAYVENRSKATPVAVTSVSTLPAEFTRTFTPRTIVAGETLAIPMTYEPTALGQHDIDVEVGHGAGSPLHFRVTALCETWLPEMVVDLGNVPLVNNRTPWLEVDVPPHAISVSIEAVADLDTIFPQLIGFEGPGGYVYENEQGTGPLTWEQIQGKIFALTIPNTDRADVQLIPGGGVYRFRFDSPGSALAVRAIIENRLDAVIDGGVIDLNVFLTPGLAIADPPSDATLSVAFARTDEILAGIGLRVGKISYFQLSNSAYDALDLVEFVPLILESAAAPTPRANVFFVSNLVPGPYGPQFSGLAAAVPGPKLNGTPASGVAINFYPADAAWMGQAIAHELGHLLGLFHTVDRDGTFDDIIDTLECPILGADSVCTVAGDANLMHWYWLSGNVMPQLTPGQARVILGHPLVDPLPTGLAGLSALAQKSAPAPAALSLPPGLCGTCR